MSNTRLPIHKRGDTFRFSFTLGNGWVGSDFTGGVKFTLRDKILKSSTEDLTDAAVIDKASMATSEITFVGAVGTIVIPAERTTAWPATLLYWDLRGVVTATGYRTTIDDGTIQIAPDVTRSF